MSIFHFGVAVTGIEGTNGRVSGVRILNDRVISGDVIVVGIGARPVTDLAASLGADVASGVVVDEYGQTDLPGVYAIGDVTEVAHPLLPGGVRIESVQQAQDQARSVAALISGSPVPPRAVPWFWSTQDQVRVQSIGFPSLASSVEVRHVADSGLSVFGFRDGRLVGVDCVNAPADFVLAKKM